MTKLTFISNTRKILKRAIEDFFDSRSFIEIDAPIIVTCPGTEVHLDYFESKWIDFHELKHKRFLRSSPELHLKQCLAEGLEKIYHIGKCFRNGGEKTDWHHPEFTMLEFYQTGINYNGFMNLTEELIHFCCQKLKSSGFTVLELPQHFPRLSVYEIFLQCTGIELIDNDTELAAKAIRKGFISIQKSDDFETAFFKLMLDAVEPWMTQQVATILYDYPPSQSALARVENNRAKRFEVYLGGIELGNAFWELTDYKENLARLEICSRSRRTIGKPEIPHDPDFLNALQHGIADCCGIAIGFDRLLALLLKANNLDSVIPFRHNSMFPL